ncbi:hypothetical protein AKN93_10930 [Thiopseudomonas alkaliphila]|uniref:hypothetical protein n=1 Tax=Thiopseudomonas alkaliphila TaxID=1697053 RepID=UPI00069D17B9|nr:hypothetical protein [Thiopseudomonas alkaliphila]AKX46748.1 hypothetical protein AKN94_04765 [Thiopseudomonas alkaliphila]AKX49852.1 hypothetical protein AKN93_10930 [Thiopseudomonas alkaliphila]AKX52261.1 hypothetical protein AKN91_00170 [Thiopseudomonas alkaliphila]
MLKSITTLSCTALALAALSSPVSAEFFKLSAQEQKLIGDMEACIANGQPTFFDKTFDSFLKKYGFYQMDIYPEKAKKRLQVISETITESEPPVNFYRTEFKEGVIMSHYKNSEHGNQGASQIEFIGKQLEFAKNVKIGSSRKAVYEAFGKSNCLMSSEENHLMYDYKQNDAGDYVFFVFDKNDRLISVDYLPYSG